MKNKNASLLILLGLLLWAGAAGLVGYNLNAQRRGGEVSEAVLEQLVPMIPPTVEEYIVVGEGEEALVEQVIPDYVLDPEREMPTETVESWDYIGILEIPELGITLPVIANWSYPALQVSPCRYTGSAYQNDLVIAAHNYTTHFGRLPNLSAGSVIRFRDMDGNQFNYEVVETEILQPTAIEEMVTGDWDLTLFTCTIGGRTRFTVRCLRQE